MSSRTEYERALARELTVVGIGGRLRRRIADEIADHLSCDPEADLGEPGGLARQFADVVGTARAKTAALAGFLALAVAGMLFAGAFLATPNGLLRAVQRAAVGVAAGIVTMLALGVIAVAVRHQLGTLSSHAGLIAAGLGLVALLASVPALWEAARVRPTADGEPGDVFDDLGPLAPAGLRGRPWRFAVLFAVAVAVVITVAAVPAQDVYDGALRGILDALACLAGFAVLGRYLGLWRPGEPGESVAD